MNNKNVPYCILHLPHSSIKIPKEDIETFVLDDALIENELLKMTDRFTDELFKFDDQRVSSLVFPVSRLIVDVERFPDDNDEPMAAQGMGVVYSKTHDAKPLRNERIMPHVLENLISKYYHPHHLALENLVENALNQFEKVIVIDCHSFPSHPLACDLDQSLDRPEICIGTDDFHTPTKLVNFVKSYWELQGFSIDINRPYAGTLVPLKFYKKDNRVTSMMVEIRRNLYMDEEKGHKNKNFENLQSCCSNLISQILATF
jgi:N-formylglutamate deformylase